MDLLMEWVATGAFHNSDELYDAPKCHPHTRVAVLDDIMQWVCTTESEREDFMMWLFGAAGAGKSAIAKRIAEIAAEKGLLIAAFFFSRTSSTRGSKDRLIATLAYQLALSIPETRTYIEDAVERDPAIFNKSIRTQIDTLLVAPFQSLLSAQIIPSQKLIIVDGLDECNGSQVQVAILDAICRSFPTHQLPIKFLVVSRPEIDLVTSFNSDEPIKSIHRRLALDHGYEPDDDIRLFFSDKFEHIKLTHPLRSTIPVSWPTEELLKTLVRKSSGQFIYAATVVRFVESKRHQPTARLKMILEISPGAMNPFAELDALYHHVLSSVDDIQLTLRVLSFYAMTPGFAYRLRNYAVPPESFLSLEPGDIQMALINLSSIISYDESSGEVTTLHASLADFLSDKRRSNIFHIDLASTCSDFFCRILQCVKGPDGIRAGDIGLFALQSDLRPWNLTGQLRNDILNFDFDAFLTAVIRYYYKEPVFIHLVLDSLVIWAFEIWMPILSTAGLEQRDKIEALDRCKRSFQSRFQKYQSDGRLQLLLSLVVAFAMDRSYIHMVPDGFPSCRCMDILLEMDDHHLHLVDQDALDLRHCLTRYFRPPAELIDIMSLHVDRDQHASTAIHCIRFISNPPTYSHSNYPPGEGLIYAEWRGICKMALYILCRLFKIANASSELVEFISDHDIDPAVQKHFSESVWDVDMNILAFLSRANVCVSWRILSAIRRARGTTSDHTPYIEEEDEEMTRRSILQRLDQCCSTAGHHFHYILLEK